MMKLTVNKNLNARTVKPGVQSNCPFYLISGAEVEIDSVVLGDELDKNPVWYKSTDGYFYWSGGFQETEFVLQGLEQSMLSPDLVQAMLSGALDANYTKFKKKYPDFTGMGITEDPANQETVFTAQFKPDAALPDIPDLMYKGISISVFKEHTNRLVLNWGPFANRLGPGGSILAIEADSAGACGFKAFRPAAEGTFKAYLVTNYHVAAASKLMKNILTCEDDNDNVQIAMPAFKPNSPIGILESGDFDELLDSAIIFLLNDASVDGQLPDGTPIHDYVDIFDKKGFLNKTVIMYGAMSGKVRGRIFSTNFPQEGSLNGVEYTKSKLIKIKLNGNQSQHGDSGSPVLMSSQLIGIIIGNDGAYTYVVPVERILKRYKLKLTPK